MSHLLLQKHNTFVFYPFSGYTVTTALRFRHTRILLPTKGIYATRTICVKTHQSLAHLTTESHTHSVFRVVAAVIVCIFCLSDTGAVDEPLH